MKNVVREAELAWTEQGHGESFLVKRKRLGAAGGGDKLGCSLIELPPRKRSWPFHAHLGNEEAIYVLSGRPTVRLAKEEVELGPGDYVALPAGEGHPHQVINRTDEPVRYLALSTNSYPDVCVYPDANKVAALAGPPAPKGQPGPLRKFFKAESEVDYWAGED